MGLARRFYSEYLVPPNIGEGSKLLDDAGTRRAGEHVTEARFRVSTRVSE